MSTSNVVAIAEPSNLTLEVVEYDKTVIVRPDQDAVELRRVCFEVDKETVRSSSKHLHILLDPSGHFKESAASHVVLEDDNISAVEIWLRVLHNKETQRSYTVAVSILRQLIVIADKYIIEDLSPVCTWFEEWFDRWDTVHLGSIPGVNTARELLYPTWRLNHATAFARVTKFLVYEGSGHITESYPRDGGTHLHLPPRIIRTF